MPRTSTSGLRRDAKASTQQRPIVQNIQEVHRCRACNLAGTKLICGFSTENWLNDFAMHVRQPAVAAVGAEGQLLVVNAEQMQNRRVHVVARGFVFHRPPRRTDRKSEIRSPKSERRPKSEIRKYLPSFASKSESWIPSLCRSFGFRASDFFRHSDFELRISG